MIENEKAIANLNMIRVAFISVNTKEQLKIINDTFDAAIEALKQKPKCYCPNCGTRMPESEDKS